MLVNRKRMNVSGNNLLIMYHWNTLVKRKQHRATLHLNDIRLVSNGDKHSGFFADKIDSKLFWIGSLEILPSIIGLIMTEKAKPFLFNFDYVVVGIIMSVVVAYLFSDDVPDQPIGLNNTQENKVVDL